MKNMILISSENFNPRRHDLLASMVQTNFVDTEHYRKQSESLTGSDIMPAVVYKGRLIPRGVLGERDFSIAPKAKVA